MLSWPNGFHGERWGDPKFPMNFYDMFFCIYLLVTKALNINLLYTVISEQSCKSVAIPLTVLSSITNIFYK